MTKPPLHRSERTDKGVLTVRFDGIRPGWEQWLLLTSDRHWDNPLSDRQLQKKHLEQAVQRGALIMDIGDLFCAMQGKFDRRADKSAIRPEHANNRYLDSLVETAVDWFKPYAKHWLFCSPGNHEAAIQKHHEVDLTGNFVSVLNREAGSNVHRMTYAGWVRFMFTFRGTVRQAHRLYYNHGYGGGGPVTRGVIQTNRMGVYTDAEIVWTGHTHDEWIMPVARQRLTVAGAAFIDEQIHVKTAGYKDEFSPMEGYHIESGRPPKPLGAAWLRFFYEGRQIRFEVTRAK